MSGPSVPVATRHRVPRSPTFIYRGVTEPTISLALPNTRRAVESTRDQVTLDGGLAPDHRAGAAGRPTRRRPRSAANPREPTMTADELDREHARQLTAMGSDPRTARRPAAPASHGPRGAETLRRRDAGARGGGGIRIWADLHFDDERIWCVAERPWPAVEPMNTALRRSWCESMAPGATMVCAGDIGGRRTIPSRWHPPCAELPDPWHAVLGNHDFTGSSAARRHWGPGPRR